MKKTTHVSALVIILSCLLFACSTVPVTGRSQLNLVPESTMLAMSFGQYDNFLAANKVVTGTADARMVQTVGEKIRKAVESYFAGQGLSEELAGYQWEFHLVDSREVNAWCMPGGKVVIYTGILPMTRDETGLAVVMGHEIAHAVARHGNERMSQSLVAQMGGMAFSTAIAQQPEETRALWMAAYGLGTQYGIMLPYSRLHENEADHLGLIFMAIAGYDPKAALAFWQRMSEKSGAKPPAFLSTHPSDRTRIRNISQLIPEAMGYYRK